MPDAPADPGIPEALGQDLNDAGPAGPEEETLRADTQEIEEQHSNFAPDSQNQDEPLPSEQSSPTGVNQEHTNTGADAMELEPSGTPGEGINGDSDNNKGGTKRQPEDCEFLTESLPPPPLSRAAIEGRIRRVFRKRKDGSTPVGDYWADLWNDTTNGGREEVMAVFEKVGYDRDRSRPN